jgi:hypothetical protein
MAPPRGRLLPHRQAFHETDTAHPAAGLLRERAGEADGLVRRAAKWETGDDRWSSRDV